MTAHSNATTLSSGSSGSSAIPNQVSATSRSRQAGPGRRTHRAKSTGAAQPALPPRPTPAWDTDLPSSGSQPGTFSADGTFILPQAGGPSSGRSRNEKPNGRKTPRRQQSQPRPGQKRTIVPAAAAPMPVTMPTGSFTPDGRFVDSVEELAELADSPAGLKNRTRTDKSKSMSSLIHPGRTGSSKKTAHGAATTAATGISTPAKELAYAGPTFHASPDPSALPIPRFFSAAKSGLSKSDSEDVIEVVSMPRPRPVPNPSHPTSPPETPTPKVASLRAPQPTDSPLDIFFLSQKNPGGSTDPNRTSPTPDGPTGPAEPGQVTSRKEFLTQLIGSVHPPPQARSSPRPAIPSHLGAGPLQFSTPSRPTLDDQSSPFNVRPTMAGPHPFSHSEPPVGHHQMHPHPFPPTGPASGPRNSQFRYGNTNLSHLFKAASGPGGRPPAGPAGRMNGYSRPRAHRSAISADLTQIEEGVRRISTDPK